MLYFFKFYAPNFEDFFLYFFLYIFLYFFYFFWYSFLYFFYKKCNCIAVIALLTKNNNTVTKSLLEEK